MFTDQSANSAMRNRSAGPLTCRSSGHTIILEKVRSTCIMRIAQLSCWLSLLARVAIFTHAEPVNHWTFDALAATKSATQPNTASETSRFRDEISRDFDRVVGEPLEVKC
jgi:hypothetical protein